MASIKNQKLLPKNILSLRSLILLILLGSLGVLFFSFSRWVAQNGWLSPEVYFFAFRSRLFHHASPQEGLGHFFLTYPFLPFLLSLFFSSPLFPPVVTGIFVTLFAIPWLKRFTPFCATLVFAGFLTSPFFLATLCVSPTIILFYALFLNALLTLLSFEKTNLVLYLFLGGISLGLTILVLPLPWWFLIALGGYILTNVRRPFTQRVSLLLVFFFPSMAILGILAFSHWVYSDTSFGFLRASYSFLPHFPPFTWENLRSSLPSLRLWHLFFFLPFLWSMRRERRLLFWGAILGIGNLWMGFPPSVLVTLFLFAAAFLGNTNPFPARNTFLGFSFLLCLVAGWLLFVHNPSSFFAPIPYTDLSLKVPDYVSINRQLPSPSKTLILDHDSFLSVILTTPHPPITSESPLFGMATTHPHLFCDSIVAPHDYENPFPQFEEVWQGQTLKLYQKLP